MPESTASPVRGSAAGPIHVDQLVLVAGPRREASDRVPLDVGTSSRRHLTAVADPASGPYWLVLSESANDGWHLDVDGAAVLARSTVDGYANGWLVDPSSAAPVAIDLRWTPQRLVWAGMAVSAITAMIALLVLARGRGSDPPALLRDQFPALGPPTAHRRGAVMGAAAVAATWIFAGTAAAVIVAGILALRVAAPWARLPVAAGAALAVVAGEMTSRPTLVLLALGIVLAELATDRLHPPADTSTAAPG